jgi:hypothetical protein
MIQSVIQNGDGSLDIQATQINSDANRRYMYRGLKLLRKRIMENSTKQRIGSHNQGGEHRQVH